MISLAIKTILVYLIAINGEGSLTRNENVQLIFPQVRKQFLRIGVDVRLGGYVRVRRNPAARLVSDPCDRYWYWVDYVQRHYPKLKYKMVHLIVPPKIVNGERYGCGTSSGGCYKRQSWPISFSTGIRPLSASGNGYKWTVKIMTHELGHTLGATHISNNQCSNQASIMCPGILPEPLQWATESIKQIKSCLA